MPSESLTVAVTSGFGIGIIAGIVSGVCYILVHGFSGNRPHIKKNQWHCAVCGERFRSIGGVLDLDKVITCKKCGEKVCRKKCSDQDQGCWICQTCLNPESWFTGILKTFHSNSIINKAVSKMDPNRIDEADEDLELIKIKEKEQVRDFIERLVESMLGGDIDGTSIGRLYADKKYDILITRYHRDLTNTLTELSSALHMSIANLPILGQSPCSAHASLKLLVQRIIQDAIGLPNLKKVAEHQGEPVEEVNRAYEDLLATAIINKVVENYQEELPISSANSVSSRRSNLSTPNNKEYFFGEETLDSKWRNCSSAAGDVDTTSVSSVEEWVRSSSSACSTKFVNHKSLTIQQREPEISSSDEESKTKEWQENWKLQKRQFAGTASPIPVPMLVPNPTIEAKVLIGDRDADDTTDLSDAGSECEETEKIIEIRSNGFLFNNKHEEDILSDSTTDDLGIVIEKNGILEEFLSSQYDSLDEKIWETVNTKINLSEPLEDTSLDSCIEQDSEYTEKYATLPKTILKCSSPVVSDPLVNSVNDDDNTKVKTDETQKVNETEQVDKNDDEIRTFEGSYSKREKQKWKNAVEMKNNPYTEENINRRLHETSSTISSLFGRDYYIREAARATGARIAKDIASDDVVSKNFKESSNDTTSHEFIFKAVPAVVEVDSSYHTDSESQVEIGSPKPPSSLLEISSDSDLSIERTYNLTSGKVYEKVGNIHKEIVKRTSSPEGLKYTPTNTEGRIKEVVDENHNSMTSDKKRSFLRSLTNSEDDTENTLTITNDEVFCEEQIKSCMSNVPLVVNNELCVKKGELSMDYVHNDEAFSIQEVSIDLSTESDIKTSAESSLNSNPDVEIDDLKYKHLVRNRLGQFSRSYPHLAAIPPKKTFEKQTYFESSDKRDAQKLSNGVSESKICIFPEQVSLAENGTSVNDLTKIFTSVQEKDDLMHRQVHSLTARSIPQIIRKELQEAQHTEDHHNHSMSEDSSTHKESSVIKEKEQHSIFPNARSRIKFFENLNR